MLRSEKVALFFGAVSLTCTARQVGERLESRRLNRLDTNSNVKLVEDWDDQPVDMKTLFWSYFHRGSVERSGLFSSGYNRASPRIWVGRARLKSNFGDEVMLRANRIFYQFSK